MLLKNPPLSFFCLLLMRSLHNLTFQLFAGTTSKCILTVSKATTFITLQKVLSKLLHPHISPKWLSDELTILLLPLLCSLPPGLDVPAGHPPTGLRPNQTKPHIFPPKLVSRSPKRLNRLRRQGAANNSQAITFKLSYTIKRPTVLSFLQ